MSSGVLNDRLMIKYRLQEAFKNIIFISDHDFAQDPAYKKANQALYARLKKLEDALNTDRPRSVEDVIPDSHLTKYGVYQYDEGRELSYTSSAGSISVYYPCIYKSDVIKEPWMLPEVEQIFMHTLLNSSCNFKLYETDLERLEKGDLLESTVPGFASQSSSNDLPNMFPVFERTGGKNLFPGETEEKEVRLPPPLHFSVNSYGEAVLQERILSDIVRELWNTPKEEKRQNVFRIYKSTLDNIFVEDNHLKYVNRVKSVHSERTLQYLVQSMLALNDAIPKLPLSTTQPLVVQEEPITPPVRRLYSDVVQGNKSPTNIQTDTPSSTKSTTDNFLLAEPKNLSHMSLNNSSNSALSPDKCGSLHEITTHLQLDEASCVSESNLPDDNLENKVPEPTVKFSYSEAVSNIPEYPPDQNTPINESDGNYRINSNSNYQNFFSPLQYVPNTVYSGNYRLGSYSNTFTGALAGQQIHSNRPSVNNYQQHPWFLPTYRPPNLCSYGNVLGQLFVPQEPMNKTRWTNPNLQYNRAPSQQNVYQPVNQNWGFQNVYTSNSNIQMPGYSSYEQKSKPKKSSNNPAAGKFTRSKTPDHGAISKTKSAFSKKSTTSISHHHKIISKPSSDYKLMSRYDDPPTMPVINPPLPLPIENDPNIPISLSASDELEQIALREYQSSNDLFFTEIERQAQEQYDGNPENLCCPPTKHLCLGGLAAFILAFYNKTISTPHISLLKLRWYYLHIAMFTV